MATLSKKQREALPDSAFALSGRRFPIHDADHARAAVIDAGRAYRAGSITAAERQEVLAKAKAALKKHRKGK